MAFVVTLALVYGAGLVWNFVASGGVTWNFAWPLHVAKHLYDEVRGDNDVGPGKE